MVLSERLDVLRKLRRGEGYGARMNEIDAVRVEMDRVAGKLHNHHSSLPENTRIRDEYRLSTR